MFDFTKLYETRGGSPKFNAQANLAGRTHYVDDDSLGFHKARIVGAQPVDGGLLYVIVESVATNYENTRRGFRYVIFDLFGNVVSRVPLEECVTSSGAAWRQMWKFLDTIDAKAVNLEALERAERQFNHTAAELRAKLEE